MSYTGCQPASWSGFRFARVRSASFEIEFFDLRTCAASFNTGLDAGIRFERKVFHSTFGLADRGRLGLPLIVF